MADPYIDRRETLIYGLFAREQRKEVCLGKIQALDAMVLSRSEHAVSRPNID